jgi:hypothetical protein
MLAVSDAASLVSDGINPLLDQAIGDFRVLSEQSTDALIAGRHAPCLLPEQDARGEAGFPPRPVCIVARYSHAFLNLPDLEGDFNPAPRPWEIGIEGGERFPESDSVALRHSMIRADTGG